MTILRISHLMIARLLIGGAVLLAATMGAPAVWAQDAKDKEIQELKQRLDRLEKELGVKKEAPPAPAAAPAPGAPAAPAAPEEAAKPAEETPYPMTQVTGIYTDATTKDLGTLTGFKLFEGIKVRGWLSTYYVYNTNAPKREVVNRPDNQASSAVVGQDITIEGRTFDVHSNSFQFDLAEIELEKVPEPGGVGFKLDLAFGDTQNIIANTINEDIKFFDRYIQHASVSYVLPVARGVRFDVGKFVTHIGGETIESIKNNNFSHGFFYTYGIPFQDTGIRINYPWTDTFYTELYVLNGWNVTFDNNSGKTFSVSAGWTPNSTFSMVANWMGGPEQKDNSSNYRHLFDGQFYVNFTQRLRALFNYDVGFEDKDPRVPTGTKDSFWWGLMGVVRYKVTENFDPAFRLEYYSDPDGATTNLAQRLWAATLTLDYKLGAGKYANILVRPEYRYDRSTEKFFTEGDQFRNQKDQHTLGVNLVFYF